MPSCTGIDLSKILGENQNIGEKVVITDECMGVFQLLGDTHPGCPPNSTPMPSCKYDYIHVIEPSQPTIKNSKTTFSNLYCDYCIQISFIAVGNKIKS